MVKAKTLNVPVIDGTGTYRVVKIKDTSVSSFEKQLAKLNKLKNG